MKARYCKNCGYEINEQGVCLGCGRNYLNKSSVVKLLYSILLLVSVISVFYFYNKAKESEQTAIEMIQFYNEIDNEFVVRFGTYENPETGEKVDGVYSYLEALDAQMRLDGTTY